MLNFYDLKKTGDIIKQRRNELGLTLDALAKSCDTTRQTLSKWEKGDGEMTFEQAAKLCNKLGFDIGHLLGEYPELTRRAADICQGTGLTESALDNLLKFDENQLNFISYMISSGAISFVALKASQCVDIKLKVAHCINSVLPNLPTVDMEKFLNMKYDSIEFETVAKRTQIKDEITKQDNDYSANLWRCEKYMCYAIEEYIKEEVANNVKA